jgi:transposase
MQRREFSEEFRSEAVKLAKMGEAPVSQIARDLGIHDSVLYRWIRKHDDRLKHNVRVADGLSDDERGELARLRRKVKRLETEREILKKAVGIFSEELR